MASFNLPANFGLIQGIALAYPYLLPGASDQPQASFADMDTKKPIFAAANIMSLHVRPRIDYPEHPLETGTMITDHLVLQPVEITVNVILEKNDYRTVYNDIQNYYYAGKLIGVFARSGGYANMAIREMPHEENPDMYDALSMEITLKEIILVTPAQGTMTAGNQRDAQNANAIQQGQKTPGSGITGINTNAQQDALDNRLKGGQ